MKRFRCDCGQWLFFENTRCLACSRLVGFDPDTGTIVAIESEAPPRSQAETGETASEPLPTGIVADSSSGRRLRRCANALPHRACNWWVDAESDKRLCRSCRLTEVIPNLTQPGNVERWRRLESAKRRLLYTLVQLELPFEGDGVTPDLRFAFLEDQRTNPEVAESFVPIGHFRGRITVHAAEADDAYREAQRDALGQPYRTVLGHLRHESGHYFWLRLIRDGGRLDDFRARFGDETADYDTALERFYRQPQDSDWRQLYISPYARAHPLEDWAESWKHFLHAVDTLETAQSFGLVSDAVSHQDDFDRWLDSWIELTVVLNELNRSMGLADAYPFVVSTPVREKLDFIRSVVCSAGRPT